MILDCQTLIVESQKRRLKYLFFWGHTPKRPGGVDSSCFSQWYPASFEEAGIRYETAEHYMMAKKAELFGDEAIRKQILAQSHPNQAKALGRKVSSFDHEVWDAHKFHIVEQANRLKFTQHLNLQAYLLGTDDRVLVEASPYDKVWGIGMGKDHPQAEQPEHWKGENLLGFALMAVRDYIRANPYFDSSSDRA
ncbi:NADAR family protein [Paenibacillus taiwanensis]|uniref:NADAR family protein n=1 Tax=Paenibacillus taiwanensis TaxID=401638 RepID=UPI000416912C|nr:NADAR family protein [Paenibacillus taiwanensis]